MGMSQNDEISVRVTATTGELRPGMDAAANDVERSAQRMRQAVDGMNGAIGSAMTNMANSVRAANDEATREFEKLSAEFDKTRDKFQKGLTFGSSSADYAAAGKKVFESTRTDAERLASETARLNQLFRAGAIDADTHARAIQDLSSSQSDMAATAARAGSAIGTILAGTIVAAGAAFVATTNSMDMMNDEAQRLSMTTESLSKLGYAGKMSGLEFNDMTQAISRLSSKMQDAASGNKQAQTWFKDVGVSVTDTSGKMKSVETVVQEVADRFAKFENGADKTALAVDGFGRAGAKLVPLLNQGSAGIREMYSEAEKMGAVIGGQGAEDAGKFNDNLDRMGFLLKGAARGIVEDMLPAMNRLLNQFILGMKYSDGFFDALMKYGLTNPFKDQAEHVKELSAEASKLEDKISIGRGTADDEKRLRSLQQQLSYYKEIAAAESGAAQSGQADAGVAPIRRTQTTGKTSQKADSRIDKWEAELSAQKSAFMEENKLYEMSLADEKSYWDELLQRTDLNEKERGQIMKKAADLRLQQLKKSAADGRSLAQEEIDQWKRDATYSIDVQQQAAQQQAAMGIISKTELLQQEREFEQQRYEINRSAIEQRLELISKDPSMSPVEYQKLKNQLLEIDKKHELDKKAILNKIDVEQNSPWGASFKTMESSFGQAINGMIFRAQTLQQAISGIFQSMAGTAINEFSRMGVQWAIGEAKKTAATEAGAATRLAIEKSASAVTTSTKGSEATAVVGANAAEAASGAAAAVAPTPFIGPALAISAFAATMAMVMGAKSSIKSARGGYDIPSGVNPMVQAHEEEMVLPKDPANTVRSLKDLPAMMSEVRTAMAGNSSAGQASAGGGDVHLHVTAMDAKSVRDYFKQNSHALAPGLRQMARNFTPIKA